MIPVFVCRSKGKLIEDPETEEQMSKEAVMITSLCPPDSSQHFQAEDPFHLALLIQLLYFPQTSGRLLQSQSGHSSHWTHWWFPTTGFLLISVSPQICSGNSPKEESPLWLQILQTKPFHRYLSCWFRRHLKWRQDSKREGLFCCSPLQGSHLD